MKISRIVQVLSKTSHSLEQCKQTGIYKIYHLKYPDIFYIGSASSTKKWREGFLDRWLSHEKDLRNQKHASLFLQRVVNKYTIDALRFEILEYCSPDKCIEREQYYLDSLKPFNKSGYNTCKIAGSTRGIGTPLNNKTTSIKICKYNLDGSFIETFPSIHEAHRVTKINLTSINACCKKKYKYAGFFQWRYYNETKEASIKNIKNNKIFKIACYYKGNLKFIGTMKEAEKYTKKSNISMYCSIKANSSRSRKGWLFRKGLDDVPKTINYTVFNKLKK